MRSAEIGQQKHIPHTRTNRSASTPVGSVAQHAAASDEAAGAAMGGCCRTGAAARFVFGCPPAAIGLCAVEEATRWSSEPPEEGRACLRRTYHRAADAAGVLDRVRVFDRWQDEDSVERFRCTRLGKPSDRKKAAPAFVELITAQPTLPECLIEFESSIGGKMRIQWKGSAAPDWASLQIGRRPRLPSSNLSPRSRRCRSA